MPNSLPASRATPDNAQRREAPGSSSSAALARALHAPMFLAVASAAPLVAQQPAASLNALPTTVSSAVLGAPRVAQSEDHTHRMCNDAALRDTLILVLRLERND